jgi:hypothetical protein
MVQSFSALLNLPNERRIPVDANHNDIVKFDLRSNRILATVIRELRECTGTESTELVVQRAAS